MAPKRDPQNVQAWLIGSGIASLAAAVHLVQQAKVPPHQVHILDAHHASGGAMEVSGDARYGYVLHTGAQPYFYEQCVKDLLAMVPSSENPDRTLWESIKNQHETSTKPTGKAHTRAISQTVDGSRRVDTHKLPIGAKLRMDLIKFIFENEKMFESKKIEDVFDAKFFESGFWTLWSTSFLLQRWHSAAEFHRLLSKWLPELHTHNDVRALERTPFTLFESLVTPITTYLKEQGVDFRFNVMVTDLKSYPASDPTTISELVLQENGHELLITVDPVDIVIVTLGSVSTGMQTGSNVEPPPPPSQSLNSLKSGEWSLWHKLERQSPKFGNPSNFSTRLSESQIETFTITMHDPDFMQYYANLTKDEPGTGALLSVLESPWGLTISVPHQPVFATQPQSVHVIWGYALHPERTGKYVVKPMEQCSGKEIFRELLFHLGFPTDPLLSSSITIPCIMPLGTSMLLSRDHHDRPHVIPHETTNLGLIGQYVEVPGDAACSLEYSVRGAQMAVASLMDLPDRPPKVGKNKFLEVFELLL